MQDHEARASDINRKLIILVLFTIFQIKATETTNKRQNLLYNSDL